MCWIKSFRYYFSLEIVKKLCIFKPSFEFNCKFIVPVSVYYLQAYFSFVLVGLEGPQPAGSEWADGGPGWEQWLWEKHDGPADTEAL